MLAFLLHRSIPCFAPVVCYNTLASISYTFANPVIMYQAPIICTKYLASSYLSNADFTSKQSFCVLKIIKKLKPAGNLYYLIQEETLLWTNQDKTLDLFVDIQYVSIQVRTVETFKCSIPSAKHLKLTQHILEQHRLHHLMQLQHNHKWLLISIT